VPREKMRNSIIRGNHLPSWSELAATYLIVGKCLSTNTRTHLLNPVIPRVP
jgi:hypothetical protein